MKLFIFFLVVLFAPLPASAGTITLNFGAPVTITTTTAEDAALERARVALGRRRGREGGVQFATVEAMLREILSDAIVHHKRGADDLDAGDACVAYKALTAAQRNAINAQLGGKSPCP